jgi:hypothetical protein
MIGYELVSEEEAAAHMTVGRWIAKGLFALRKAGIGQIVKVKLNPDRKTRYSNVAGEYARRLGMVVTCRTRHGYLWIEYLGEAPEWAKDLPALKAKAAGEIRRGLGK